MACELLLNEIENELADENMTKRIKAMVQRILAKSRQAGMTVKGLVGVVLGTNPKKNNSLFVDMHHESSPEKTSKSWHF